MGKKTYQSGGKYARQSSQPKKKRQRKPSQPINTNAAAPLAEASDDAPRPVSQPIRSTARHPDPAAIASSYSYVISDLKRTGMFAVAAFAILIILAVVLS